MSEPVFERLWHDVTSRLSHHHDPEGTTMSVSGILADVSTDLSALMANATDDYNRIKAAVEAKLPEVTATVQKIEADPFITGYLGAELAVPEHLVGIALDFLGKLVQVAPAGPGQQTAA